MKNALTILAVLIGALGWPPSVYSSNTCPSYNIVNANNCGAASLQSLCLQNKQILKFLSSLEKRVATCCSKLNNECNVSCKKIFAISQKDIPFRAIHEGYYCLKEDVTFDGSLVPNEGFEGPIGIALDAQNVELDLNNHTINFSGTGANALATIGNSGHITIKNGTIVGPLTDQDAVGILLLTGDVTVKNVRIINTAGLGSAAIEIQGALLPSPTSPTITYTLASDITIEDCDLQANNVGISLNTFTNGVRIKNCTIDHSIQMGITQPSRSNSATNVFIDGCTISNSGLNGVYTTYTQANWSFTNCKISDSILNGMILEGFKNLSLQNCQVYNSGAHGIIASIRHSENVSLDNCQIFNAGDAALRIDNIDNLSIRNSQFTNSIRTSSPVIKLQDIFQGTMAHCTITSTAGTSDALFIRNCRGIAISHTNIHTSCSATTCPVGINLQGNVTGTTIRNCSITGTPSVGIALQQDMLNGTDSGVVIEESLIQGAQLQGILFSHATKSAVYNCKIIGSGSDGIRLDAQTDQSSIRDNTLVSNGGFGINNLNAVGNNKIYHNFAQGNVLGSFNGIPPALITAPAPHVGVLENIDN